jgi:hypothetical protein
MIALLLLLCAGISADQHYQQGITLARQQRWEEARKAFAAGQREAPVDKRFPLELAGVAYRLKHYEVAKSYLRRALQLDPRDSYGNDFLGTLYFLDGNLEAALKYWNRVGKPHIEEVNVEPKLRLNPLLLDRAFAFSPASVVLLEQYRDTRAWLDALDVFSRYRFELAARPEEQFDLRLRASERPARPGVIAVLARLPFQAIQPEFHDIGGSGANWSNLLRWDAQKRRVRTALSGPLRGNPKWRYSLFADGRRETWNTGGAEDFRLSKVEAGAEIISIVNSRLRWSSGFEVARRVLSNAPEFESGYSLKYRAGVERSLVRNPERRFRLDSGGNLELGRMLSGSRDAFRRLQGALSAHWFPKARGEDYAMTMSLRAGKTAGNAPFDELFILGLERDNDLWLRGHVGTRGGKKGSAPMGGNYVLVNWEMDKELYRNGYFSVAAGPFLDSGRVYDERTQIGPRRWLWDTGAQCKVRVLGGATVVITYGRDLRSGGDALYVAVER